MFVLTYLAKGKAVPLNCLLWLWKLSKQSQRETSLSSGTVRRYKDWRTEIFNRTHLHRDSELNCKFLTTRGSLVLICWTHLIPMANESLVQPQTVRWVKSYSGGMLEEEWSEEETSERHKCSAWERSSFALPAKSPWRDPVQPGWSAAEMPAGGMEALLAQPGRLHIQQGGNPGRKEAQAALNGH